MNEINLPMIAIVGRVNVGKSTLFNRLIEKRKALVSDIPGTTRDLNYGLVEWDTQRFIAVDTGGILEKRINTLEAESKKAEKSIKDEENLLAMNIEKRSRDVLEKCQALIFLVDARDGLLSADREIAKILRATKLPVILAANKSETEAAKQKANDFVRLGFGQVLPISAATGVGLGDLLDEILKIIPKQEGRHKKTAEKEIKVAIVGQPNVGKSSLLNQMLGEDRVIVSALPHTTREPQDTLIDFQGEKIRLIDTAGIRRKSKVTPESLESTGISMSVATLKKCDIALFTLDISRNLNSQDLELGNLIARNFVSVIILVNKYDALNTDIETTKQLALYLSQNFPFLSFAPVLYISALSGRNCQKILPLVLEVATERKKMVDKKDLNDLLQRLYKKMPPPLQPKKRGGQIKSRAYISKIVQKDTNPPVFSLHVENTIKIPDSYLNFIEKYLRERYKFLGTPIKLIVERGE